MRHRNQSVPHFNIGIYSHCPTNHLYNNYITKLLICQYMYNIIYNLLKFIAY